MSSIKRYRVKCVRNGTVRYVIKDGFNGGQNGYPTTLYTANPADAWATVSPTLAEKVMLYARGRSGMGMYHTDITIELVESPSWVIRHRTNTGDTYIYRRYEPTPYFMYNNSGIERAMRFQTKEEAKEVAAEYAAAWGYPENSNHLVVEEWAIPQSSATSLENDSDAEASAESEADWPSDDLPPASSLPAVSPREFVISYFVDGTHAGYVSKLRGKSEEDFWGDNRIENALAWASREAAEAKVSAFPRVGEFGGTYSYEVVGLVPTSSAPDTPAQKPGRFVLWLRCNPGVGTKGYVKSLIVQGYALTSQNIADACVLSSREAAQAIIDGHPDSKCGAKSIEWGIVDLDEKTDEVKPSQGRWVVKYRISGSSFCAYVSKLLDCGTNFWGATDLKDAKSWDSREAAEAVIAGLPKATAKLRSTITYELIDLNPEADTSPSWFALYFTTDGSAKRWVCQVTDGGYVRGDAEEDKRLLFDTLAAATKVIDGHPRLKLISLGWGVVDIKTGKEVFTSKVLSNNEVEKQAKKYVLVFYYVSSPTVRHYVSRVDSDGMVYGAYFRKDGMVFDSKEAAQKVIDGYPNKSLTAICWSIEEL